MRILMGIIIAPSLATVLLWLPANFVGHKYLGWSDLRMWLISIYTFYVPLAVPGVILLRVLRRQTARHYLGMGLLAGFTIYWLFGSVYPCFLDYNGNLLSKPHLYELWNINLNIKLFIAIAFGGITGFIYWYITCRFRFTSH